MTRESPSFPSSLLPPNILSDYFPSLKEFPHALALAGTQLNVFYKSLEFVFSFTLSASLSLSPALSGTLSWQLQLFGLSAQFIQFRTSVGSLLGSPFLYKSLENSLLSLSFLMWEKSKYLEPVSRVVFEEWCIFIHKCKFHFPYIVLYIIYTFLKINFEKWQFTHQSWVHPWEAHFSHSLFHGFRILQHPLTSCACPRLVSSTLSSFLQYTCNPKGIFASRLY